MTYKIVGADENNLFPPRIEDRLNAHITNIANTQIDIYDNGEKAKNNFDLSKARLNYGMALQSWRDRKTVMQSIGVEPVTRQTYYAQYDPGTVSPRETIIVSRLSPEGYVIDSMTFIDAGHGAGVFLEFDKSNDTLYVWTQFTDNDDINPSTKYHIVRVPWAGNATYTFSQVTNFILEAAEGAYRTAHYDVTTDQVGFRTANGSTGSIFTIHRMEDIKNGIWNPLSTIDHTWPSEWIQGYVPLNGTWYCVTGSDETVSPYVAATVYRIAPNGSVAEVRNVETIRNPVTHIDRGTSETEGLFTLFDSEGYGALGIGVAFGPPGARMQKFHTLSMNAMEMPSNSPVDDTGWLGRAVSWKAGYTRSTGGIPFSVRKRGNQLILCGRIEGDFTNGATTVCTLQEAFRVPTTRQLVAAKSTPTGNLRETCKVELSTSGDILVYIGSTPDITAPAPWIELPFQVVELKDYPRQGE